MRQACAPAHRSLRVLGLVYRGNFGCGRLSSRSWRRSSDLFARIIPRCLGNPATPSIRQHPDLALRWRAAAAAATTERCARVYWPNHLGFFGSPERKRRPSGGGAIVAARDRWSCVCLSSRPWRSKRGQPHRVQPGAAGETTVGYQTAVQNENAARVRCVRTAGL